MRTRFYNPGKTSEGRIFHVECQPNEIAGKILPFIKPSRVEYNLTLIFTHKEVLETLDNSVKEPSICFRISEDLNLVECFEKTFPNEDQTNFISIEPIEFNSLTELKKMQVSPVKQFKIEPN